MKTRVIIAGGGTGGHLFPGIAVAEEIRRRDPDIEPVFVGTQSGIEARVVPSMGDIFEPMNVKPLRVSSPKRIAASLFSLPLAYVQAFRILRRHKPVLVIGVGGYASGPMVLAASLFRYPTAILEQNATVGLTNRILARFVDRAYLTFEATAQTFGREKSRVFGNPVRASISQLAKRAAIDPEGFESRAKTILVLGGSQGARSLNSLVPNAIAQAGIPKGVRVLHQTGTYMVAEVQKNYHALGVAAEVAPFIDDMAKAYASAMLVIGRAGATTVAELCAIGRPSILVPYPHAQNHQRNNAQALSNAEASICIEEKVLGQDLETLIASIRKLTRDSEHREHMASRARQHGNPYAAADIVDDMTSWLSLGHLRAPSIADGVQSLKGWAV